jgi:drug/metabolite transporter (DMT)-like permease
LGHLLFAEHITSRWALGIALVISGLLLISRSVISTAPGQPPPQQQQQGASSKQGQVAAKKPL